MSVQITYAMSETVRGKTKISKKQEQWMLKAFTKC